MKINKATIWIITMLLLSLGTAAAYPQFILNTPDTTGTYNYTVPSVAINVTVYNGTDATTYAGNISTVKIWLTNLTDLVVDTTLMDANTTITNGSNADFNYTYSSNYTHMGPGNYTLTVWANDTSGNINTTTTNFTILATNSTQAQTHISGQSLGFTVQYRDADNTQNTTTNAVNGTNYTLQLTHTASSIVLNIGNIASSNGEELDSVNVSTSVSSDNDESLLNIQRVWVDTSSFVVTTDYSWTKVRFPNSPDVMYRLTGTAANPTWTEISSGCTNTTSIESGDDTSQLPCFTRASGFSYAYMASFSGAAAGDNKPTGGVTGGISGTYRVITPQTTTVPPIDTTTPTPEGEEGNFLYDNALYVIIAVLAVVYFLIPKKKGGNKTPTRKKGSKAERRKGKR